MLRAIVLASLVAAQIAYTSEAARAQMLFSSKERSRIVRYWSAPGRYSVAIPDRNQAAPWQARLTPEGSLWLWKYQRAVGAGKAAPTADPIYQAGGATVWQDWIRTKAAYDRWVARQQADRLNSDPDGQASEPRSAGALPSRGGKRRSRNAPQSADAGGRAAPPAPGPMPSDLLKLVGDAPEFAVAVKPLQHTVTFAAGDACILQDHRNVPPTYAYYRFPQGVGDGGTPLTEAERTALFNAAGLTDTQKRVMMAVSKLEGSFDAVNTYDTGHVSVGFIQFVTMEDGTHSLADVLAHEKADARSSFERDFRQYGVDLTPGRALAVVDPETGEELTGADAVQKVVDDKRLIAVFQRAGRKSAAFRIAQIRVAKESYWPEDDALSATVDGKVLTGRVCDVVKSEAGLATLFDRKVNRGNVLPLPDAISRIMSAHALTHLSDAARYEREIVAACRYRIDFLMDTTLKQPDVCPRDQEENRNDNP